MGCCAVNKSNSAAYNGAVYTKRRSVLGYKKPIRAAPLATQCPITRPKRHIQPERYMPLGLKFEKNDENGLTKNNCYDTI
jgi:hypothetical protein